MIRANRDAIKEESVARLRLSSGAPTGPARFLQKLWNTERCGCRKSLGTGAIFAP
jgi:hypothetical protein